MPKPIESKLAPAPAPATNGHDVAEAEIPPPPMEPFADPPRAEWVGTQSGMPLPLMLLGMQAILIASFLALGVAEKSSPETSSDDKFEQMYNYYIGVALMMFVGFGYLRSFLQSYGQGAVGLTMLATCIGIEVYVVVDEFLTGGALVINIATLLQANYAVAAFLISFGALIGKISPKQIVVLVVLESIFYGTNKFVVEHYFGLNDIGGTVVVHMFGAYYGLTIAYVLGAPSAAAAANFISSKVSDVFSLLGTVVLWVYWPSFVAGMAPAGTPDTELQVVQTVLSLAAATFVTFAVSSLVSPEGNLKPVVIQNATLAGGVSIGILSSTPLTAAGALTVGSVAGALSTFGFAKVKPLLEKHGLHDTCGIHNLHGMPAILGALLSVLIGFVPGSAFSPLAQLNGMLITLVMAVGTGALSAYAMMLFGDAAPRGLDASYWEVANAGERLSA